MLNRIACPTTNRRSIATLRCRAGRDQGAAARHVGVRRLRDHRHDAADRRRVALRGGRPARGIEGARRRRRQRQLLAGGRAPLVRRDVDRLRAGAARGRPRAAPRPSGCRSRSRRPTPKRCPFADASFDAVLSSFGVMFAPDHARAASELLRVCRPRRDASASPTGRRRGFVGRLFGVIGRHVPPPAGLTPPARWGMEEYLEQLFGDRRGGHPHDAARLHVPLPLRGALDRRLPHLVRPGAQGVRGAAAGGQQQLERRPARR